MRVGSRRGKPWDMATPQAFQEIDPDLLEMVLGGEPKAPLDPTRRVYVNRHLRLDSVHHVGFDLDYTLAVYRKEAIENIQFQMTRQRLVEDLDYPEEVLRLGYDPTLVLRGLVVDKRLGNLLKMDAHGHVARAFHGLRPLTREERHRIYRQSPIRLPANRFASLDSLFAIPEGALFTSLVDLFDRRLAANRDLAPVQDSSAAVSYEKLFIDVRETIDTIHRDGTLKTRIKSNLPEFIGRDTDLPVTLHNLRSAGKRLFLLTNSKWDYTNTVMSYLLDGIADEYPSWRSYFDIVVVDARKPAFFTERSPFLDLDSDGKVLGTFTRERFQREGIYAQGNIRAFERFGRTFGDRVLYVGDHIYGDILRSKKDSLWRTLLITPEVEEEVGRLIQDRIDFEQLRALDRERQQLDNEINGLKSYLPRIETVLSSTSSGRREYRLGPLELRQVEQLAKQMQLDVDTRRRTLAEVSRQLEQVEIAVDRRFNSRWGRVFKEGHELSRFGSQVENYACVYTSRVTNLRYYSPLHYFRATLDLMAHERTDQHHPS